MFFHSLVAACRRAAGQVCGRLRDLLGERGVTTAEYALLLALVVVVLISSLTTLGATLRDKLQGIIDTLTGVAP